MIFENLPSKNTPINAENLNKISPAIQSEEPTNGQEVWIENTNLIEKTPSKYEQGSLDSSSGNETTATTRLRSQYIKVKPNTTYKLNVNSNYKFAVWGYNSSKTFVSKVPSTPFWATEELVFTTTGIEYVRVVFAFSGDTTITSNEILNINVILSNKASSIKFKNGQTYDKLTDTVSVGTDSNNAGLHVEVSMNLLNPTEFRSFSGSGITVTNNNGTLTISGTPNADINSTIIQYKIPRTGTYTLATNSSISTNEPRLIYQINNGTFNSAFPSATFQANAGDTITINLRITVKTAINVTLKPMLNLGSTALPYEPHVNPSIKANVNGTYETIANKNVYSLGEVVIGEWLGKPLYRKVIDVGTLPNNTSKAVAHNIRNLSRVIRQYGYSYASNYNSVFPLPFVSNTATSSVNISTDATNINITTGSDRSNFKETYIVLEYTKTTD